MGSGIGLELPWIRMIGKRIPLPLMQRFFNGYSTVLRYGSKAIDNAKATAASSRNIFAGLIAQSDGVGQEQPSLSKLDVICEAANLIVAGSDTTAVSLTYLVWAVLRHPDVQSALEDEVSSLPADFSEGDLEQLTLLEAVIRETLRLYGAAPGSLPRRVPPGGCTVAGLFMPQDTIVSTQSYTLHRNPSTFPNSNQ